MIFIRIQHNQTRKTDMNVVLRLPEIVIVFVEAVPWLLPVTDVVDMDDESVCWEGLVLSSVGIFSVTDGVIRAVMKIFQKIRNSQIIQETHTQVY